MSAIVPIARIPVIVRPATQDDLPFIDGLQKQQSKQVGFMQTKALEGKINLGHVIVAESVVSGQSSVATDNGQLTTDKLGYCIGNDQYYKRDDLGVIYQLNIVPGKRRSLIGATLIKAMFERAAYGCKLFCCWCAQDIEANRFWESLGFVPLAFRAGSKSKDRVHIFWQKRIREGDTTTPWWFPSKTTGGAIGEERLVLPIPPGTHWSDVMPRVLPSEKPALTDQSRKSAPLQAPKIYKPRFVQFAPPSTQPAPPPVPNKPKPAKKPRQKHDPRHIAAARELRDRWLEHVNGPGGASSLLSGGKYNVGRALASASSAEPPRGTGPVFVPLLAAPAGRQRRALPNPSAAGAAA